MLVAKYADHLELYRQEQIFGRAGLSLPRSTLAAWVLLLRMDGAVGEPCGRRRIAPRRKPFAHPVCPAYFWPRACRARYSASASFQTLRPMPAKRRSCDSAARRVRSWKRKSKYCTFIQCIWSMDKQQELPAGRRCVFATHEHLGFVTKYRRKVFDGDAIERPRPMLSKVCEDFDAQLVETDGEDDHVHLLVNYTPSVSVSKLVDSLKGASISALARRAAGHRQALLRPLTARCSNGKRQSADRFRLAADVPGLRLECVPSAIHGRSPQSRERLLANWLQSFACTGRFRCQIALRPPSS